MSTESNNEFIRPNRGITGCFTTVFNAIGSIAGTVDNVAAGAEGATSHLPKTGHDLGKSWALQIEANRIAKEKLLAQA